MKLTLKILKLEMFWNKIQMLKQLINSLEGKEYYLGVKEEKK